MRYIKNNLVIRIILLTYLVLSILFTLVKADIFPLQNQKQCQFVSKTTDMLYSDKTEINTFDALVMENEKNVFSNNQYRVQLVRFTIEVYLLFYLSLFSIGLYEKRAYLIYLQSGMFPLTRFLREIRSRQKKDGKKQSSAF